MKKKSKQQYPVVKHNDLIEARYKLTLHEQKLVLQVAMMIKPEDRDFHEYRLSVKEFMNLMNVEGEGYYVKVRQKAKTLLKKPLVIPQPDGELLCNWFSSIKYLKGVGQIVLCFDPKLKPYLLQLKDNFTKYKAHNVMQFHSGFSIRVYELLKQYIKCGKRGVELDKLKAMIGIAPHQYKRFADFRIRVLDVAQKEIERRTDIKFSYKPIKTGRRITAIRFIIENQLSPADRTTQDFIDSVSPHGIAANLARDAVKIHGIEATTEIRDYALSRIAAGANGDGRPIEDPPAYLAGCLRGGHGAQTPEEREVAQEKQERIEQTRRKKAEADRQEADEKARIKGQRKLQKALILRLNPAERERLRQAAIAKLPKNRRKKDASIENQMCRMVEDFVLSV